MARGPGAIWGLLSHPDKTPGILIPGGRGWSKGQRGSWDHLAAYPQGCCPFCSAPRPPRVAPSGLGGLRQLAWGACMPRSGWTRGQGFGHSTGTPRGDVGQMKSRSPESKYKGADGARGGPRGKFKQRQKGQRQKAQRGLPGR